MNFWERISERVLVCDGAMGTQLYERGVPKGHCYDELNLSAPDIVQEVHLSYISAGAEIIETNTFGANKYILGKYYDLAKEVKEINYIGAKIAREAVSRAGVSGAQFVAGAVGPITRPLETSENLSPADMEDIFETQITALVEGGVDLIILETFASLDELILGFRVAAKVCSLPVICQLSFTEDGRTILGIDPVEAGAALDKEGAKIIGVNCGIGPQSVYESIQRMGHITHAFLSAQPNAGRASWVGERFVYPATPKYFAEYAKRYVQAGVSIIGGCCGTTPAHISAIADAVKSEYPRTRKIVKIEPHREPTTKVMAKITSPLQQKLAEKFVLTLELAPPRAPDFSAELLIAKNFRDMGGDCVNISDNPMARLRMSPVPLAHIIKEGLGIDVILHFTCRDRNLLAIQSDLIGVYALGIQNILALTGDPPSVGDYPFATAVFEIKSEQLVQIINSLNNGMDWLGNPLSNPTALFVGVGSRLDEPERTKKKIHCGAKFVQTQPVFNLEKFKDFINSIREPLSPTYGAEITANPVPIIAGILVLGSLQQAEFIKNEVPGIVIPDAIIDRMRNGLPNEGALIARELLQEIRGLCEGACIMIPGGKYELLQEVLK